MRYTGRLMSCSMGKRYGFIRLSSVRTADGYLAHLATTDDIYIHHDDLEDTALLDDVTVEFSVKPDEKRGDRALRAVKAVACTGDAPQVVLPRPPSLLPAVIPTESAPSLYVAPTERQGLQKHIAKDLVEKVLKNKPMPDIPRQMGEPEEPSAYAERLLRDLFPQFLGLSAEAQCPLHDVRFDVVIEEALHEHESLHMADQVKRLSGLAQLYREVRTLLLTQTYLLRPDAIIPMKYLPDFFMAVPVWYFVGGDDLENEVAAARTRSDPEIHPLLQRVCLLVRRNRWSNLFLMFNRTVRTLVDYTGEVIPPRVTSHMKQLAPQFDAVVIATPYLNARCAGWKALTWQRSVDPYVLGFKWGVPYFFVLDRFSGSGTFPLYTELVADTVAFLRAHRSHVDGFTVGTHTTHWYNSEDGKPATEYSLGSTLKREVRDLLREFEVNNLFEWLRGGKSKHRSWLAQLFD